MEPNITESYLRLFHAKHPSINPLCKKLLSCGGVGKYLQCSREQLLSDGFSIEDRHALENLLGPIEKASWLDDAAREQILADLQWETDRGNSIIHFDSANYPALLRRIDHPPSLLYLQGNPKILQKNQLAIVGSRKASAYGSRNAYWMAYELARAGLTISSGLAQGIDTKAHEGAIEAGTETVAVIGTGIDRCYPAINRDLVERIVASGAVVSEFPRNYPPLPGNFPRRNRIISGLCLGTLVVEANSRSGSLITARLALEQNREVFALPGSINSQVSKGCHRLLKEGAILVDEPEDILRELAGELDGGVRNISGNGSQQPLSPLSAFELSPQDKEVLRLLSEDQCLMQTLVDASTMGVQQLNAHLIRLEMLGLVKSSYGRFSRSTSPGLHSLAD